MKILATLIYAAAMFLTGILAYQHTQEIPVLSGWYAFAVFMVVPQLALATLHYACQYENDWRGR